MAFKKGTTIPEEKKREVIPCAYTTCGKNAVCRIFTKTGWANVCEAHYGTAEFTRPVANSPVMKEVLEAYRHSKQYTDRHEVMREPGCDDEVMA